MFITDERSKYAPALVTGYENAQVRARTHTHTQYYKPPESHAKPIYVRSTNIGTYR